MTVETSNGLNRQNSLLIHCYSLFLTLQQNVAILASPCEKRSCANFSVGRTSRFGKIHC